MEAETFDKNPAKEEASMEQIRDLLFGTQIKEIDVRFKRQEEKLERSIDNINGALSDRVNSIENFMKSEVTSLLDKLRKAEEERIASIKKEQKERALDIANIIEQNRQASEEFEDKISKTVSELHNIERGLRELIMAESSNISESIQSKYRECLSALKQTTDQIKEDMVYKNQLAGIFTESALKLSGQWQQTEDFSIR